MVCYETKVAREMQETFKKYGGRGKFINLIKLSESDPSQLSARQWQTVEALKATAAAYMTDLTQELMANDI